MVLVLDIANVLAEYSGSVKGDQSARKIHVLYYCVGKQHLQLFLAQEFDVLNLPHVAGR